MATKKKVGAADIQDAFSLGVEGLVNEVRKLKERSLETEGSLDSEETSKLIKLLHCAIAIAKDNRESSLQNDLTEMPDDQLERLAREALDRKSA